jgi:hypothetical protein
MKLLKIIRKFERFNFHGVPEGPELSFERDNYSHYTERQTGKAVVSAPTEIDSSNSIVIGIIQDDFENKLERFTKFTIEP